MITEDFVGYGARVAVDFGGKIEGEEMTEKVVDFMSRISLDCVDAGVKLIGHIKSITDVEGGGYLACSVTNHEGKVRTDGKLHGGSSLEMILNVMIYGLDEHDVSEIVEPRTRDFFLTQGGSVHVEQLEGEEQDHDHSRSNVTLEL